MVRTRIAPSPTGEDLHIGNLYTAYINYIWAKKNNGKFVVRVEDTDRARLVEGSEKKILSTLKAFGIVYDEGPDKKGPYEPYRQSDRLALYKKYAEELVKKGDAYYCFCSKERLDEVRKKQAAEKKVPQYDRHCLTIKDAASRIEKGEKYVVRLKVPKDKKVVVHDLIHGDVEFNSNDIDDQVLLKSDGYPTYHLGVVVDDYLMKITHVIRGEEWLSSTPKHLMLYEYLSWQPPQFAHLPLLLNPDRSKLSKRQGDVAVEDFLAKGYLPQALINFVALLGWNPGEGSTQEFFTIKDLIKQFDLTKINSSGAVFDLTKLNWLNAKYLREVIKEKDFDKLTKEKLKSHLKNNAVGKEILKDKAKYKILSKLVKDRIHFLGEIDSFFSENFWLNDVLPKFDLQLIAWKKSNLEDAISKLKELKEFLSSLKPTNYNLPTIEPLIKQWITDNSYDIGSILWPLRVALTGQEKSPSPFEVASLLGQHEVIRRINIVLDKSRN